MDLAVDYMSKAANSGYGSAECALGDMCIMKDEVFHKIIYVCRSMV